MDDERDPRERGPWPPYDLIIGPDRETDNRRFGELLERLRWKAGLSRGEAARQLGFSSEYMRLLEVGRRTPALGQMQRLIDAYGAVGDVEKVGPAGDRPDLAIIDPLNDEPTYVEFKSRIREARRRALGGTINDDDEGEERATTSSADQRVRELGVIVEMLARADLRTLLKVRHVLERERL